VEGKKVVREVEVVERAAVQQLAEAGPRVAAQQRLPDGPVVVEGVEEAAAQVVEVVVQPPPAVVATRWPEFRPSSRAPMAASRRWT
jgi:hypothetical protein